MDLILLLSVLLVVPFILLKTCKRRHICLHKLISSGEFQFGVRICSEWLCAYTGLRNWPGSKPWFPLFICRSGLLKVKLTLGPHPWPPPGGFKGRQPQGQQSFTTRACQEEKYPKSILSPQPGIYLPFVTDIRQLLAHRGEGEQREGELCLAIKIIISASVTVRDVSGLRSQFNCPEKRSLTSP